MGVVILMKMYLVEYVYLHNKTKKVNVKVFNIVKGKNDSEKTWKAYSM